MTLDMVKDYQLFEKGFDNHAYEIALGYNTQEWSATELTYQRGINFDLDFWILTGSTNFKVHDKFSVECEFQKLNFDPDPENENTSIAITTFNYQFTPDVFIRLFSQYRSVTERLYVYALFGWRYRLPNSALYLVYTRDDFESSGLKRDRNEIVFLKLAYDFTL
jgi:hypothetical protein